MTKGQPEPDQEAKRRHSLLLQAIHSLEAALASPAPGRAAEWAQRVAADLAAVTRTLDEHRQVVEAGGGLYEQLEAAMPRTTVRLRYLRETNTSLLERAELLERQVQRIAAGGGSAFMAVRASAAELLAEMRQQQAREVDLVFEAFHRDLAPID